MKTRLIAFLALVCVGLSSCYDDTALINRLDDHEQRIFNLETLCNQLNTNIASFQTIIDALQTSDYITSVSPIMEGNEEIGYVINFKNHGPVTIYHGRDGKNGTNGKDGVNGQDGKDGQDGADGQTPVIGVKKDVDGVYYWTLDGEWLLDEDGNKIKAVGQDGKDGEDGADGKDGEDGKDGADGEDGKDGADGKDGITPQLKIEDGYWYVSYDNGLTWERLYKAIGEDGKDGQDGKDGVDGKDGKDGKDGDSFFQSVDITETSITFVLADGQTFSIPMFQKINVILNVENDETTVKAGETIVISYKLENVTSEAHVTAASDGNYKVKVRKDDNYNGRIEVVCPDPYVDGFINVTVSDGNGNSYVRTVSFYEKRMSLHNGYEYNVSAEGGDVYIPFTVNFDYTVEIPYDVASWVSVVETKVADRYENLNLSVARNDNTSARKGTLYIYANNNMNTPYCEIVINQASAEFSIDKTTLLAAADGDELSTMVESSCGLSFKEDEFPEWLTVSAVQRDEYSRVYDVTMTMTANTDPTKRSFDINCYSDDGETRLGAITVIQLENGSDGKKDLVFKVRANFANDFTCVLPIQTTYHQNAGGRHAVDCFVDWGDGNIEHIKYEKKYNEWGGYDEYLPEVKHTYEGLEEGKVFEVRISGTLEALSQAAYDGKVDMSGIFEVVQWGNTGLKSMSNAFNGNTSLRTLPTDDTYSFAGVTTFYNAFSGCTGLQTIPEGLFKNCSNVQSFDYTFRNCVSLTELPEGLFAGCSSVTNFESCFYNCDGLESLPKKLFAGCENVIQFRSTFDDCDSLTSLPEDLFESCVNAENFNSCFSSCNALASVPDYLFANCTKALSFDSCFSYTVLVSLPGNLFANCSSATDFSGCFYNCDGFTYIPETLFSDCKDMTDVSSCFYNCDELVSVPVSIFDNNRKISDFYSTFAYCFYLIGESPYTVINGVKYHLYERADAPDYFVTPYSTNGCFGDSYNLSDYYMMPTSWTNW